MPVKVTSRFRFNVEGVANIFTPGQVLEKGSAVAEFALSQKLAVEETNPDTKPAALSRNSPKRRTTKAKGAPENADAAQEPKARQKKETKDAADQ